MRADVLGELVGRTIAEQIGQVVARCVTLRAELERQIADLDEELELYGARVDALEKVELLPPPAPIDPEALAERVLLRVLERLPEILNGQGISLHALASYAAAMVEARLPEPDQGAPGVGIATIEQPEPGNILVRLEDGRSFPFALPRGLPGEDGRFIAPVPWRGDGKHVRGEVVTKDGGTFWVGDDDHLVCLADGMAGLAFQQLDERRLTLSLRLASGGWLEEVLAWPVPVHRGAYDPEVDYEPGDEVASNGCTWRCRASGRVPEPPGEQWWLVAKQGRPGRPGEPGSGKDGVGIRSIWRQGNALMIALDNGDTQSIDLPEGEEG